MWICVVIIYTILTILLMVMLFNAPIAEEFDRDGFVIKEPAKSLLKLWENLFAIIRQRLCRLFSSKQR